MRRFGGQFLAAALVFAGVCLSAAPLQAAAAAAVQQPQALTKQSTETVKQSTAVAKQAVVADYSDNRFHGHTHFGIAIYHGRGGRAKTRGYLLQRQTSRRFADEKVVQNSQTVHKNQKN